jgi:restriction system protein
MLPSGTQALFTNRVAWAVTHMTQAGSLTRPERGRYLLTAGIGMPPIATM